MNKNQYYPTMRDNKQFEFIEIFINIHNAYRP